MRTLIDPFMDIVTGEASRFQYICEDIFRKASALQKFQ